MLDLIFPKSIDNHYRGQRLALLLLWLIVGMNVAIDLGAIFTPDGGAETADGIPLSTYPAAAAAAVIGVAAYLGLAGLMLDLIYVLALVRYRAMVPLMYALLVVQYPAHKAIGLMKPIVRAGDPHGGWITLGLFVLTLIGFALSLTGKYRRGAPQGRRAA